MALGGAARGLGGCGGRDTVVGYVSDGDADAVREVRCAAEGVWGGYEESVVDYVC